jgi:predicted cupin superfamily sugar epimerase
MAIQTADQVILALDLAAHPEGGFYKETYRDRSAPSRGHGTAIHFLLRSEQVSHWHRIDAVEIFHYYAGLPLELQLWTPGNVITRHVLGPNVLDGHSPTVIIAPHTWQTARPLARARGEYDFSLVGCTVMPAFEFSGFTLAAPGWQPPVDS